MGVYLDAWDSHYQNQVGMSIAGECVPRCEIRIIEWTGAGVGVDVGVHNELTQGSHSVVTRVRIEVDRGVRI